MKNQSGVTILSLVVTIVILIILAGISINLILGEDGLIQKAKQAKENTELAQIEEQTSLNELYSVLKSEIGSSGEIDYDAITKLAEFKKAIADYIEEAGGVKPEYSAETITFGDSIKGILKEVTKNATATVDDIAEGKTAYVNGALITGTKKPEKGFNINNETLCITSGACGFSPIPNTLKSISTFSDSSTAVNYAGSIRSFKTIDLTNVNKITFNIDYYKSGTGYMYLEIAGNTLWWKNDVGTLNNTTFSVDVSGITGEQYIYFGYTSVKSNPSSGNSNAYTCSFTTTFNDIIFE